MSVGVVNKQTGDRIPTAGMPAIDDALDLTSVNPVQNAIVTAALALKQNATDNNLQTTDKTVVGAVNELKSGLTNVDVALSVPDGTGKNVIAMSLDSIKAENTEGTWSGNVYTRNGVSFTFNTDSSGNITSIDKSGTSTAVSSIRLYVGKLNKGSYLISGGLSNSIAVGAYNSSGTVIYCTGSDKPYELTSDVSNCNVHIIVGNGNSETATIYPMIRPATITDPTFAPYIPSVDARLDAVESGLTNVGNRDKVFMFSQNAVPSVLSFTGTATPRTLLAQIIIVGQGGVTSTVNVSTKGSGSSVNLASTQIYPSGNDYGIVTSGEDDGKVNITSGNIVGGWGKIYVRSFDHSMDNASVSITYVTE